MGESRWIDLDGAANVRDLGGLRTADGGVTRPDRLIRSDNLQGLTPADVRRLVDDHGVRVIADLRTEVEVQAEGPGPMLAEPSVTVRNLSLLPEAGVNTDAAADSDGSVVLPWQTREAERKRAGKPRPTAADIYLRYLDDRGDAVVDALRLIAHAEGAAIVHCAAGKDRTGVVVAVALAEVGVVREAIIDDYALSAQRIEGVFARLGASPTYAGDLAGQSMDSHRPRAETMQKVLDAVDERYGGVPAWLRAHRWTDEDAAALRAHLLGRPESPER